MKPNLETSTGPNDIRCNLWEGYSVADGDLTWGRWEDVKDGRYLIPSYLSGSDYSGSLIERTNANVWGETFPSGEGQWWANLYGGHGTYGIIIDLERIPPDESDAVWEFLTALQEYPSADDEALSLAESEAQEEAWERWACQDFRRELEKLHPDLDLDPVSNEALTAAFHPARDAANEYWVNEQGGDVWIRLGPIAAKVPRDYLTTNGATPQEA